MANIKIHKPQPKGELVVQSLSITSSVKLGKKISISEIYLKNLITVKNIKWHFGSTFVIRYILETIWKYLVQCFGITFPGYVSHFIPNLQRVIDLPYLKDMSDH